MPATDRRRVTVLVDDDLRTPELDRIDVDMFYAMLGAPALDDELRRVEDVTAVVERLFERNAVAIRRARLRDDNRVSPKHVWDPHRRRHEKPVNDRIEQH